MRVAVTGGAGFVGRFIVRALAAAGHEVEILSRRPEDGGRAFDLGAPEAVDLAGVGALVHAAFDHVPGRYRGGEGGDPAGFLSRNLGGTATLFRHAKASGVRRIVFLSTRAVYGDYPPGTSLDEDLPPRPDTLYGHVKREAEGVLAGLTGPDLAGVSLRVTGVYGPPAPGRDHKWSDLFRRFERGEAIAPRVATEVHGDDVAAAVGLFLAAPPVSGVFNVSDIMLDRADLLATYSGVTGIIGRLPPRADPAQVSAMTTGHLGALGWSPRGMSGLGPALTQMCGGQKWPGAGGGNAFGA